MNRKRFNERLKGILVWATARLGLTPAVLPQLFPVAEVAQSVEQLGACTAVFERKWLFYS